METLGFIITSIFITGNLFALLLLIIGFYKEKLKLVKIALLIIIVTLIIGISGFFMVNQERIRRHKIRRRNERVALYKLKNFTVSMATYSYDHPSSEYENVYPSNVQMFGDYYSHKQVRAGYRYIYSTNKSKTKFVYYAQPLNADKGRMIFFTEESNKIWFIELQTDYNGPKKLKYNWEEQEKKRLELPDSAAGDIWQRRT